MNKDYMEDGKHSIYRSDIHQNIIKFYKWPQVDLFKNKNKH